MTGDRAGLIVWLQHQKFARALRKYGHVHYVSENMNYAVLYCDANNVQRTWQQLRQLRFVRTVEKSHLGQLATEYSHIKQKYLTAHHRL